MKIYTKTGDYGKTKTITGAVVDKDNCLIQVNGDIDSLQSQFDKVLYRLTSIPGYSVHISLIEDIQSLLWQLGGEISGMKPKDKLSDYIIDETWVSILEQSIDDFGLDLKDFCRFRNPIATDVNEARVRTRNLERTLTKYLRENNLRPDMYKFINRLSDYLFMLSVDIENKSSGCNNGTKNN